MMQELKSIIYLQFHKLVVWFMNLSLEHPGPFSMQDFRLSLIYLPNCADIWKPRKGSQ